MAVYLVTGGAGFIGSHIVDELVRRGERVRVLDNFSTGRPDNLRAAIGAIELIEGDIREWETVRRAVEGVDYVLHQAAIVSVPQSMNDPITTHAVNVDGALNLLLAARQFNVKRVVLASSCAVYGDNDDLPLKECSITHPLSPYAASKLAGEVYGQTLYRAYGLPTVCLRYFNVYGPRQNPDGDYAAVIPKFARRFAAGQAPIVYGDGLQTRDFVHVDDVVRANLLACERAEAIGQVFNIASGRSVSLLELIEGFNQLTGARLAPQHEAPRDGDIKHSCGDGEAIAATLGFKPAVSLLEGLKTVLRKS
jgi:UDP-glucose 4-epimerase